MALTATVYNLEGEIPVHECGAGFVEEVAATIDRRATVSVSVTERQR